MNHNWLVNNWMVMGLNLGLCEIWFPFC